MKALDISLILAEYIKAKKEAADAQQDFETSPADKIEAALVRYEEAEGYLAEIACKIVDSLVATM